MGVVDDAVAAVRAGKPVIVPTDTVYGLCATPYRSEPVERLYALKQRDPMQPIALAASSIDMLFECVPELRGRAGTIVRALLPGPYTLIVPNPARRYRWLTGPRPDAIGVRVPELQGDALAVFERVGALAATSANLHGGSEPRTVDEIPEELRQEVAAIVDGGELPGAPSTVVDFTGPEPRVLREGAGDAARALAVVTAVSA
jgi:tRNA threonylcarbamoyl adenosine modification protein (Sua5/YciO/YrdC/YwlC family)